MTGSLFRTQSIAAAILTWLRETRPGRRTFLALGALSGPADGPGVRVTGVGRDSIQGDVQFAAFLERMGARIAWGENWIEARPPVSGKLHGIHADCTEIPDAAMTLAADRADG